MRTKLFLACSLFALACNSAGGSAVTAAQGTWTGNAQSFGLDCTTNAVGSSMNTATVQLGINPDGTAIIRHMWAGSSAPASCDFLLTGSGSTLTIAGQGSCPELGVEILRGSGTLAGDLLDFNVDIQVPPPPEPRCQRIHYMFTRMRP